MIGSNFSVHFAAMPAFLYEESVSYRRHLIVPWIAMDNIEHPRYSYRLLSEFGHQGQFHQAENPAGYYAPQIEQVICAAKQHLDSYVIGLSLADFYPMDYFRDREVYRHNLIILHQMGDRFFYDHYPPNRLGNIAAPKMFASAADCLSWVKQGLDRHAAAITDDR